MKINITKKEYRLLLDMICIADWILEAFADNEVNYPAHQAIRLKFFALATDMEAQDVIEYDSVLNDYFETQSYEEYIQSHFIEPFEEKLFWDELIHRLAMRDLVAEVGHEAYNQMDAIQRIKRIHCLEQHYHSEFQTNGLDKLVIK